MPHTAENPSLSLQAHQVAWQTQAGKTIISDVSLQVQPGEILGLLGPNGSGKSTLLRLLAGIRRCSAGQVSYRGRDLARWPRHQLARHIAFVEQQASTDAAVTVREVVALGRTPHKGAWAPLDAHDQHIILGALQQVGLAHKADALWPTLSGGERQRAQIARALAQQPSELLMDEPTNHLDIEHQLEILALVASLGLTCVIALHDLNHAALYCHRLMVMQGGRMVACGTPQQVLSEQRLLDTFNVRSSQHVAKLHRSAQPLLEFARRAPGQASANPHTTAHTAPTA